MSNQFDPLLQEILDGMHILATQDASSNVIALRRNLLLYIQDRCVKAYRLGMARGTCHVAGEPMPPIPQWLKDLGVTQ